MEQQVEERKGGYKDCGESLLDIELKVTYAMLSHAPYLVTDQQHDPGKLRPINGHQLDISSGSCGLPQRRSHTVFMLYMVLVLWRRELPLRDLRKSGPGFPSSIVICVYRENLHDYEPSSQSWQSVNQSRYRAMCEDGNDCLPPVKRWHKVRDPVPMIGDVRRTDR